MIAILAPTRGRPEQCRRMIDSVNGASIYIAWTESLDYQSYRPFIMGKGHKLLNVPENMPTAHKWNLLAEIALENPENKLFILGADDMVFETSGWDKALIDHYNELENKIHVYALQDSRDKDGTPHPIVTREYIESMGYFVPPIFLHWFVDSWTVAIASANNSFTHMRDFILTHDKPSDKGQPDATHSRIREWGWSERDKWVTEKMAHVLAGEKERLKRTINA